MTRNVDNIVEERGSRYGDFADQALLIERLNGLQHAEMVGNPQYDELDEKEQAIVSYTLTMVNMKIARIVQGDPTYDDNWVDIEGYVKRAREKLEEHAEMRNNKLGAAS